MARFKLHIDESEWKPDSSAFDLARHILLRKCRLDDSGSPSENANVAIAGRIAAAEATTLEPQEDPENYADTLDRARDGARYHAALAIHSVLGKWLEKKLTPFLESGDPVRFPKRFSRIVEKTLGDMTDKLKKECLDGFVPAESDTMRKVFATKGRADMAFDVIKQTYWSLAYDPHDKAFEAATRAIGVWPVEDGFELVVPRHMLDTVRKNERMSGLGPDR